jgi:hypothetical protein
MNQVNEENESDIKNKNLTRKEEWCGGEEGGRMLRRQLDTREWEEKRKMRVYCLCSVVVGFHELRRKVSLPQTTREWQLDQYALICDAI